MVIIIEWLLKGNFGTCLPKFLLLPKSECYGQLAHMQMFFGEIAQNAFLSAYKTAVEILTNE